MKNILIVVDERKMGGVSILLEDLINNLDRLNLNIDILSLHDNGNRFENLPEDVNLIFGTPYFEVIDLPIKEVIKSKKIKLILKKIRLVFDMKTGLIKNRIKKERKKILIKNYDIEIAFKDGFTALFVGYGSCDNKIHWLHYDYKSINPNAKYDKLFKKILPIFNKIIAVSKGVMDDFNEIYHLEDKTEVIANYVNVEKIKSMANQSKVNKTNKIEIVSVGRLHFTKSYNRLIDAIEKLNTNNLLKNVVFKIYGDGPEKDFLQKKIDVLKLNKYIKLMGQTNNPYDKIINSDLFVLPSIYESFGLVVIEALTLGIPVIATKTSATSELIKNDFNGIIVDNTTEGIYIGLKNILGNPKILDKYKNNLKKYDYNIQNKKIMNKINNLLK